MYTTVAYVNWYIVTINAGTVMEIMWRNKSFLGYLLYFFQNFWVHFTSGSKPDKVTFGQPSYSNCVTYPVLWKSLRSFCTLPQYVQKCYADDLQMYLWFSKLGWVFMNFFEMTLKMNTITFSYLQEVSLLNFLWSSRVFFKRCKNNLQMLLRALIIILNDPKNTRMWHASFCR